MCDLSPQNPKTDFFKALEVKILFFLHILITGSPILFLFLPKYCSRCMKGACYVSWLSNIFGLRFDPPNNKNGVFQSMRGEKVVFLRILITGSPIPILFLTETFNICMGGECQVSWLSDQRFAFWPPQKQKTEFCKAYEVKSCFSWKSW